MTKLTNQGRQARAMSETQIKQAVTQMLTAHKYVWKHDRPARYKDGGYATHFEGHGGYPDISVVHPKTGKILKYELKVELPSKGVVSEDQQVWLDAYAVAAAKAPDVIASGVWRPSDLLNGTIEETIKWGAS